MLESDNKKEKVEQDKGNREYLGRVSRFGN